MKKKDKNNCADNTKDNIIEININVLTLLSPKQAAQLLDVEEHTLAIWRCAKRYGLPYVKVGRLVKYRASDLQAFLQARTVYSPA